MTEWTEAALTFAWLLSAHIEEIIAAAFLCCPPSVLSVASLVGLVWMLKS